MKLTPWFPRGTTPVRPGYYDTRWPGSAVEIRLYWTGRVWVASPISKPYTSGMFYQSREWRGVFSHAKTK